MEGGLSRREFLTVSVGAAAAGGVRAEGSAGQSNVRLPETLRVGIIGLEGHYSEITDAARSLPNLRVTAVAEAQAALAEPAKRQAALAKARFYDDCRAMLDAEPLDVVAVCGENGVRAAVIRECAARRLPIVAEKPLTLTLEELDAVRKAVARHRVPLTMLLPMRFYPAYHAMRDLVRRGDVGDVIAIGAQKSYKLGSRPAWMKDRRRYGGTIPYIGIHMVDLMRWVSGRDFTEAAAFQSSLGFPEIGDMENNAAVIFRMDNRGTASLRLDYLRPATAPTHGDDRLRIAGTKGVLEYQAAGGLALMTGTRTPAPVTDLPAPKSLFVDFVESLHGGSPHVIQSDEVYRVTEIVLKAREAAESGRMVRL